MKPLVSAIFLFSLTHGVFAQGGNIPITLTEHGRDSKPISDNISTKLAEEMKRKFSEAQFDEVAATRELDRWIDTRKIHWRDFTESKIQEIRNSGIQKLKASIVVGAQKYNTTLAELGVDFTRTFKESVDSNSPQMIVRGQYQYIEGSRDPGVPGWSLVEKFHVGVDRVKGKGVAKLEILDGIDLSGSIGIVGIDAHVPLTIGAEISGECGVERIELGQGTAFSPMNKPTAKTTYEPRISMLGAGQVVSHSMVNITVTGEITSIWSCGELAFTLTAKPQ